MVSVASGVFIAYPKKQRMFLASYANLCITCRVIFKIKMFTDSYFCAVANAKFEMLRNIILLMLFNTISRNRGLLLLLLLLLLVLLIIKMTNSNK